MILTSGELSVPRRVVGAILLAASLSFPVDVGHAAQTGSTPDSVITVPLSRKDVDSAFLNWSVSIIPQSAPFRQEPAAAGQVYRGWLGFSSDRSNAIPFLWLRSAGTLYLDLNRNRDLTDDAEGAFRARESTPGQYQTFAGVRVSFTTSSGTRSQLLDLNLWNYSSQPNVTAALRTFWQGRVELNGTDYQAGVVEVPFDRDNRASYLLLRPWEARDESFNVGQDVSGGTMSFPERLFVAARLYRTEFKGSSEGSDTAQLLLTRQEAPLGELKLTGAFIRRMVLQERGTSVILERPTGTVQVPAGRYSEAKVWLQEGGVNAFRTSQRQPLNRTLIIRTNQPATFTAGGPLTNSVSVTRRGGRLVLNYELIGADGEAYQLAARDYSNPPRFLVFSGDRQIDTGKFEFG